MVFEKLFSLTIARRWLGSEFVKQNTDPRIQVHKNLKDPEPGWARNYSFTTDQTFQKVGSCSVSNTKSWNNSDFCEEEFWIHIYIDLQ
jgi:hypothetical protein